MLIRPLYRSFENRESALVIASASTLAGNLTVLGSIANLIVRQEAHKQHIEISFGEYLRVGLPVDDPNSVTRCRNAIGRIVTSWTAA
jgi:Na+/H+ antiporter NhaD/arsenite permease-like protein